jgi:hypothetical protein
MSQRCSEAFADDVVVSGMMPQPDSLQPEVTKSELQQHDKHRADGICVQTDILRFAQNLCAATVASLGGPLSDGSIRQVIPLLGMLLHNSGIPIAVTMTLNQNPSCG